MSCQNILCPHPKCSGACGNSVSIEKKLGKGGARVYMESRKIVLEDFYRVFTEEKYIKSEFIRHINIFENLEEAYDKLNKVRKVTLLKMNK